MGNHRDPKIPKPKRLTKPKTSKTLTKSDVLSIDTGSGTVHVQHSSPKPVSPNVISNLASPHETRPQVEQPKFLQAYSTETKNTLDQSYGVGQSTMLQAGVSDQIFELERIVSDLNHRYKQA